MERFKVGRTLDVDSISKLIFPQGKVCIIYDGDSVLCEFSTQPDSAAIEQAKYVCEILNAAYAIAEITNPNTV